MRAAKLEELKAEVKIVMENHEHAVECRDSIIQVKTFQASPKERPSVFPTNARLCLPAFLGMQVHSSSLICGLLQRNDQASILPV